MAAPHVGARAARGSDLIPGGALCYSKDDEHFPPNAPRFIANGQGAHVWDPDGREYLDWGMGLRSVILGHAYPEVTRMARHALDVGANHTRPTLYEGRLAELLCDLIPCAEMVKFGKNGSDAVTAAVRLARAATGRLPVLACRDPFHASDDWWLSTQARDAGTFPQKTETFTYGWPCWEYLDFDQYAAVVLEPMSFERPPTGWLERLRAECTKAGALLIFDEVITGFRFALRGAQSLFGVTPDLACFGKALGNGFSVSALCGPRWLMSTPKVHLLSSTHGGETHALAAAIATVETLIESNWGEFVHLGKRLISGLQQAGYTVRGDPTSPDIVFRSAEAHMKFQFGMCERGILAPYIAPSFAHTAADVARTVAAAAEIAESVLA